MSGSAPSSRSGPPAQSSKSPTVNSAPSSQQNKIKKTSGRNLLATGAPVVRQPSTRNPKKNPRPPPSDDSDSSGLSDLTESDEMSSSTDKYKEKKLQKSGGGMTNKKDDPVGKGMPAGAATTSIKIKLPAGFGKPPGSGNLPLHPRSSSPRPRQPQDIGARGEKKSDRSNGKGREDVRVPSPGRGGGLGKSGGASYFAGFDDRRKGNEPDDGERMTDGNEVATIGRNLMILGDAGTHQPFYTRPTHHPIGQAPPLPQLGPSLTHLLSVGHANNLYLEECPACFSDAIIIARESLCECLRLLVSLGVKMELSGKQDPQHGGVVVSHGELVEGVMPSMAGLAERLLDHARSLQREMDDPAVHLKLIRLERKEWVEGGIPTAVDKMYRAVTRVIDGWNELMIEGKKERTPTAIDLPTKSTAIAALNGLVEKCYALWEYGSVFRVEAIRQTTPAFVTPPRQRAYANPRSLNCTPTRLRILPSPAAAAQAGGPTLGGIRTPGSPITTTTFPPINNIGTRRPRYSSPPFADAENAYRMPQSPTDPFTNLMEPRSLDDVLNGMDLNGFGGSAGSQGEAPFGSGLNGGLQEPQLVNDHASGSGGNGHGGDDGSGEQDFGGYFDFDAAGDESPASPGAFPLAGQQS